MNVQYLHDSKGKLTGVFIPIREWEKIKKNGRLPDESPAVDDAYVEPTKEEIVEGLKHAIEEVKLHRAGKIKLQSAREFLKEL
ncbi:hypothetical protein [Rudanella lutea]|uniref:hypothetical protein n=1 Tax=Rudanella lutea TaxID=451374 RepID=UPI000368D4F9|nr:hypothetical protein [Rudanella lutea]